MAAVRSFFTENKLVMKESGFLEIFVNNDAQTPVYYDNMMVSQTVGPVMEVNAYYPYGMIIPNLSVEATFPNGKNFYKFGAKELQEMTGWGDHHARMLDHTVGRWWVPDPLAEKYYHISPYAYCANNPIRYIDPDGQDWKEVEEEDEEGNKHIRYTVTISTRNSAKLSEKQISEYFYQIKTEFESSFQGKDGNVSYSATLVLDNSEEDFYIDFVDQVVDKDGNVRRVVGLTDYTGNTKKNRIQVLANSNDLGNTGAHELGHTSGLSHESGIDDLDLNGVKMGDVQTNLMKEGYPIGKNITTHQLKYIQGVIRHGYTPTPVIPRIKTPMPTLRYNK